MRMLPLLTFLVCMDWVLVLSLTRFGGQMRGSGWEKKDQADGDENETTDF